MAKLQNTAEEQRQKCLLSIEGCLPLQSDAPPNCDARLAAQCKKVASCQCNMTVTHLACLDVELILQMLQMVDTIPGVPLAISGTEEGETE